jgi:hypothetical protein
MTFWGTLIALLFWVVFFTVLLAKLREEYPPIDKSARRDYESMKRHQDLRGK